MKILGIETSTLSCEVALAQDDEILAFARLPESSKPTASLVPCIRDLCRSLGWSVREVGMICVDQGPGSYTGLRVGLTCAKTLAFAAGADLAVIGSLEVVAHNAPSNEHLVEVAFDAARGQVFACRFRRNCETWAPSHEVRIENVEHWVQGLEPSALVSGPALVKYRNLVPADIRVADDSDWWPRAARVIQLGLRQLRSGPLAPYWTLEPLYLRPSAAEEKRAASQV